MPLTTRECNANKAEDKTMEYIDEQQNAKTPHIYIPQQHGPCTNRHVIQRQHDTSLLYNTSFVGPKLNYYQVEQNKYLVLGLEDVTVNHNARNCANIAGQIY
jgi:hypothetical protein